LTDNTGCEFPDKILPAPALTDWLTELAPATVVIDRDRARAVIAISVFMEKRYQNILSKGS
jgi:hypothetical protein